MNSRKGERQTMTRTILATMLLVSATATAQTPPKTATMTPDIATVFNPVTENAD